MRNNKYPKHTTAIAPPISSGKKLVDKHLEDGLTAYRNLVAVLGKDSHQPGELYEARHAVTEWEVANSGR